MHIQNNYLMSDVTMLLKILAPYPEAKQAIVEYYRERSAPLEPDLDSRTGFRHREWQKCWKLIKPDQKCGAKL